MLMMQNINFQTPEWICREMIKLIPPTALYILEPTPGAGNLVKVLRENHFNVTTPIDFWSGGGFFDVVVMNPPFSPMQVGYRILYRCMEMTETIIAIMPWLTLINSERRTRDIMTWGLKSITHLPRKAFPGARVQCCILNMRKGYDGQTDFMYIVDD